MQNDASVPVRAVNTTQAADAPQEAAMGPGDLVNTWHEIKTQVDGVTARLGVLLEYAARVRNQLALEFDISVPSLAAIRPVDQQDDSDDAPVEEPTEADLAPTDPEAAAVVEGNLPVQAPIESVVHPTTTLTVDKIRGDAKTEGADPADFTKSISRQMQNALKTIE